MKLSYLWKSYGLVKHLKEIPVFAISTAKDIYGTIHNIVDYRVGIFPFNVNNCDVTDTLFSNGASEISFQPAQPTK